MAAIFAEALRGLLLDLLSAPLALEGSRVAVLTSDLTDTWERISHGLRQVLPDAAYEIWLEPLRPVAHVGHTLTVEAPPEVGAWVRQRFGPVLTRVTREVLGPDTRIDIVPATRAPGSPGPRSGGGASTSGGAEQPQDTAVADDRDLNPKFTFEQFVIGDANRLAHAAALAVAELPGQAYNPLFIYGPPGVGKTHLLHSIGNYIRAYGGGMTVRCATAEHFTNEFVAALHTKRIDAFKGRYRRNDVLLIDDVQFLQDKTRTEEEFFHTFNALYETGGQLVLTCDRLPRDMEALEERLRERFESGLLADIKPPDLATRVGVLRKRASFDEIELPDEDVLEIVAHRVTTNIRALEGALIRVVAYSSLTGRPITMPLAEEVLAGLYPSTSRDRPVSVERIQELVCGEFRISREELISTSRAARLTWPRHLAMSLAREHTDETLPAIGEKFGGRHHSTVLHAIRHTADRIAADPDAYGIVRSLTERLLAGEADRGS